LHDNPLQNILSLFCFSKLTALVEEFSDKFSQLILSKFFSSKEIALEQLFNDK
jgi:hypothetical protein